MPNQDINEIFRTNLKRLLEKNNESYSSLAKNLGVSRSTVSMWITGKSLPRMELLDLIADYFNVSVSDLLIPTDSIMIEYDLTEMYKSLTSKEKKEVRHFIDFLKSKRSVQE